MSDENKTRDVVDQDVVTLELGEESEGAKETSNKRGKLEEQRKGINALLEQSDKAHAVIEEFRGVLRKSDYSEDEEKEFFVADAAARKADRDYVNTLRKGEKSLNKKNRSIKHAMDQIRKAKRRGRPLVSKRPELKEEFCIGNKLTNSLSSIRFQGPLVLAAVKEHFDDLPKYTKDALKAFEASLNTLESDVLHRNRMLIRIRQQRALRDEALERLREELSDLRLAAQIAAETDEGILSFI